MSQCLSEFWRHASLWTLFIHHMTSVPVHRSKAPSWKRRLCEISRIFNLTLLVCIQTIVTFSCFTCQFIILVVYRLKDWGFTLCLLMKYLWLGQTYSQGNSPLPSMHAWYSTTFLPRSPWCLVVDRLLLTFLKLRVPLWSYILIPRHISSELVVIVNKNRFVSENSYSLI